VRNYDLPFLPERPTKPRNSGLTMVMDKGLSLREAEDFISVSGPHTDLLKLGFGTSVVTPNLKEKIKLYKEVGLKVYFGGTLFEAYYVRGLTERYKKMLDDYQLDTVEISDGSIVLNHDKKCEIIREFSKNFNVVSEVGSKEAGIIVSPGKWKKMMVNELEAGSWKVIAEARESGNVGIYRPSGNAHTMLINQILAKVKSEQIIWEAPQKSQQVWFIKLLGANVNLGNISPNEVIPLETLRIGLRGDTFFNFLPEELQVNKPIF
jgi:phosphosulfolactate synthase